MEVKASHLVRLSPIWLLISSTTGFDFTDYGYDECEISLEKASCHSKSGGGYGPANVQNCEGIPDDERARLDNVYFVDCCIGDGMLDISCTARQKQISCQRGYSWSRPNGERDDNGFSGYDSHHLTTQGSLIVFFSERHARREGRKTIYPDPEYMLHQLSTISSGSSDEYIGYEMYCNGTVSKVTRPEPPDICGISLGCGIGALFAVLFLVIGLLCYCGGRKEAKRHMREEQSSRFILAQLTAEAAATTDTELISTRTERDQLTVDLNHSRSNIEPTEQETDSDIQAWRAGIPIITNSTPSVLDDPSVIAWRTRSSVISAESPQEHPHVPERQISQTQPSYESLLRPPPGYADVINH